MADLPEELVRAVGSCLHLINATDELEGAEGHEHDPTRSLWHDDWKTFYERVRKGKVVATCVIDFPYADKGGLNLAGDDRFLERMYCFDEQDGAARRVVLHAHTLLRWGRRRDKEMDCRADMITSINCRHAWETSAGEFEQEVKKYFLIPISQDLQDAWRKLVSAGRSTSSIEWDRRKSPIKLPEGETSGQTRVTRVYQQLQHVIELAEFIFSDGYFFESRHMGDTDTLIRGGGTIEFEGRAVTRKNVPVTIPSSVVVTQAFEDSVIGGIARPAPWPTRVNILFSGANTAGKPELELEKEYKGIRNVMLGKARSDRFVVHPSYFSTVSELVEELNTLSPTILHFACHGEEDALALFDDDASAEELTRKIRSLATSGGMRLVVLNACHSDALAQSLAPHVDFTIGHCGAVLDSTAESFSRNFYSSLANGHTVHESFSAAWVSSYTLRGQAARFGVDRPTTAQEGAAASSSEDELAKLPWQAVVRWLRTLQVDERVVRIVAKEKVPGYQILAMNLDELITDLSMSKLQAKRVLMRPGIFELVAHTTAQAMADGELSDASTDGREESSDESEGEESHTVAFAAKHGGDPDSFRTHMRGLFSDVLNFMQEFDPDAGTEHFSFEAEGVAHQWTCSMLLWVSFVQHAELDADARALWMGCLCHGCNQARLLATLETCSRRAATSHPLWSASDFEALQCTKPHARCVAITDRMVQRLARGRTAELDRWSTWVTGGWFANEEPSTAFFLRANRFLRSHLEGLEVLQTPFKIQSYVAFLFASPVAAALLDSYLYLKARRLSSPLPAGGFFVFASSKGSIEPATDAQPPVLSRALVTRGLQCLAKLPPSARSTLGTTDSLLSYAPAEFEDITRIHERHRRQQHPPVLRPAGGEVVLLDPHRGDRQRRDEEERQRHRADELPAPALRSSGEEFSEQIQLPEERSESEESYEPEEVGAASVESDVFEGVSGYMDRLLALKQQQPGSQLLVLKSQLHDLPPGGPQNAMLDAIIDAVEPEASGPTRSSRSATDQTRTVTEVKLAWAQLRDSVCRIADGSFFVASVMPTSTASFMTPFYAADSKRKYKVPREVEICLALQNFMPTAVSLEGFYVAEDGGATSEGVIELAASGKTVLKLKSELGKDEEREGWRIKTLRGEVVLEVEYFAE